MALLNFQMAPKPKLLISSGSKKKEPSYICLSEAKTSHSHKMWAEVSSLTPHFLHKGLSSSPSRWRCLLRMLWPVSRPVTALDWIHMTWLHPFYNKATKVALFTCTLPQSVMLQTSVWAAWRGVVLCGSITVSLLIAVLRIVWNIDFIVSHLVIVTVDESEHCNSISRGSWIIQACNL